MADSAAEQQASSTSASSETHQGSSGPGSAEPELLEAKIVERLERMVRAAGYRLRRLRSRIKERRELAAGGIGSASTEAQSSSSMSSFQVPEEVRGIVERYPIQAMIASCGAGYLLGALVSGRRK